MKTAGTPEEDFELAVNVGICKRGGGVNVDRLTGMTGVGNAANIVWLIVGVVKGVAVGGGAIIGRDPPESETKAAYTQAVPSGLPG